MASAGSLDIVVSADIAQAVPAFGKVGAVAAQEMKRIERAQADAKKEGDRFITMLEKQVETFGLSGTALLSYEAKMKGVADQAQPLINKLNEMREAQARLNAQTAAYGADSSAVAKLQAKYAAESAQRIADAKMVADAEVAAERTATNLKLQYLNADIAARKKAIAQRLADEKSAEQASQALRLQYVNADIANVKRLQAKYAAERADAIVSPGTSSGRSAIAQIGHDAEMARGPTSGFTRELLVLGHELSQGQYKRFGGSLLVLAEYSGTATKALSALVGPLGVVAGAAALMALAIFHGHEESEKLRLSLITTGNYAGVTEGKFNSLARQLSGETGISLGKTRDAIQALISTGEIGPAVLGPLAKAVTLYAKATGETEETVAKDFARMGDGVTKFAVEHNKQLNFLSLAQYDYIKRLEEQGKAEEAQLVVANALTAHFRDAMKPNLGYLEKAIKSAGLAWDSFWDSAKGVGREQTVADKIEAQRSIVAQLTKDAQSSKKSTTDIAENIAKAKRIEDAANRVSAGAGGDPLSKGREPKLALEQAKLDAMLKQEAAENALAKAAAETGEVEKKRISAAEYVKEINKKYKATDELTIALQKYRHEVDLLKNTDDKVSPKEQNQREADIRHSFRSPLEKQAESEAQRLKTALDEQLKSREKNLAKINDEIDQLKLYGKVVDSGAEAQERVELASAKYAKASEKQKAIIIDVAKEEDRRATVKRLMIDKINEETAATKAVAEAQKSLNDFAAKAQINSDAEIDRIRETTKELGLNTLELKQHNAERAIQEALDKKLSETRMAGVDQQPAKDAAAKQIADRRKALAEEDTAQRQFGFGASRVFKQYQDDAANSAKFAENVIVGSMRQAEDAIINFAKTGKLSFGSLFAFMAEEYLRQTLRMSMAALMPGGGGMGSILGLIGGLFGGPAGAAVGAAVGGGSPYDLGGSGVRFGSPHANGGSVANDMSYLVGERGPEVFKPSVAGTIIPNSALGGGHSVSVGMGQVINIGQGVSRGEVAAAINSANKQSEARIQRGLRQGSFA